MAKLTSVRDMGESPVPRPTGGVVSYQPSTGTSEAPGLALAKFGQTMEVSADHLYQIQKVEQDKADTTRAEDAFNQLRKASLDLTIGEQNGFVNKKGAAAVNQPLFGDYSAKFEDLAKGLEAGLANDDQRKKFRQRANIQTLEFQQDLLRHITAERKDYSKEVFAGTLATELASATARWQDAPAVALSMERSRAAVERRSEEEGWSPEYKQAQMLDAESKIHASVIGQAVATNNYEFAAKYYELNKDGIDPVTAKLVQKAIEDGTQKQLTNNYQAEFISNRDNPKGIADLEARIATDPRLDDARKNMLMGRTAARSDVLERRAQVESDRRERMLQNGINQVNALTLNGYEPTVEQMSPLITAAKGTALEGQVDQMVAVANETGKFRRLAPVQQEAYIANLEAEVRKDPTKFDANMVSRFKTIYEKQRQDVKDNPTGFMVRQGFVSENAAGAGMIDLSKPDQITGPLAGRFSIARTARDRYQAEFKPLQPEEVALLTRTMKTMNAEQKRSYFAGLAKSSGTDIEGYKAIMQQLAPDSPATAAAGIYAQRGLTDPKGSQVSDSILRGEEYLNPPKDKDGKPVKGGLPLPPDATLLNEFNSAVGNAFVGKPEARNIYYQTAKAIFADKLVQAGDYTGTSSGRLWKDSIDLATGGIYGWNGQKIVLPWGMASGDFKDGLSTRIDAIAPSLPEGVTPRDVRNLPLQNIGDGRYEVRSGDQPLLDRAGNKIVIDFNLSPQAAQPVVIPPTPGFQVTPGGGATGKSGGKAAIKTTDVTNMPPAVRAHHENIAALEDEMGKPGQTPNNKARLQKLIDEENAQFSKSGSGGGGGKYGNRTDGTPKGDGFLGPLKRPDGDISTEISVGVNIDGKEIEIPTLVPTLSQAEIKQMLALKPKEKIPAPILQKAVDFARERIKAGKPVFATPEESKSGSGGGSATMTKAEADARAKSGNFDDVDDAAARRRAQQFDNSGTPAKTGVTAANREGLIKQLMGNRKLTRKQAETEADRMLATRGGS